MEENAGKMVGANVRKDSLDRNVNWEKNLSAVEKNRNGKDEKEEIDIEIE